ncbi:MAG: hypothetical protein AB7O65_13640 [Candidatus Korobacteraceae bacterium]
MDDRAVMIAESALLHLAAEIQAFGFNPENGARLGKEIGALFGLQGHEVGILRLEGENLVFCHPAILQKAGSVPLNDSSSTAARTATSQQAQIINNFVQVKHLSVFETVYLGDREDEGENDTRGLPIQKLM